jgi:hypothetical protein
VLERLGDPSSGWDIAVIRNAVVIAMPQCLKCCRDFESHEDLDAAGTDTPQ